MPPISNTIRPSRFCLCFEAAIKNKQIILPDQSFEKKLVKKITGLIYKCFPADLERLCKKFHNNDGFLNNLFLYLAFELI